MSDFQRYAIYYLPDDEALAAFGASWLGWDVVAGKSCQQPDVAGLRDLTATPRKYGFHGTLKPPFRLAEGTAVQDLDTALRAFAEGAAAVQIDGLRPAAIGRFLALVPEGDATRLGQLAFTCVSTFDRFRRPASPEELARRRSAGLSDRQEALLQQFGYPYVGEEFRFHLTLTGALDPEARIHAMNALQDHLPPLPSPFRLASVALVGERQDGRFQQVHRYALTG